MDDKCVMTVTGDEPIRPRFPIHVTAFGIPSVLISEADYEEMLQRSVTFERSGRLSQLDKDPEVRAFILDRRGTDDMDRIREAAIERFGAERVPSRSAVNRMVVRTKVQSGWLGKKAPT